MKKLFLLAFALLLCSSLAYAAETVSTAELKTTLIDSIKDYLSSQSPKLAKEELKDLIIVYLTTNGDTTDLSGTGQYSGKKLIDIYNKAKGINTQTCISAGGTCKANTCNTYNNCNTVSATCASGYCCSGSCGFTEEWIPAEDTPSFARLNKISLAAGEERIYLAKVDADNLTRLKVKILGLTQETYATISLELPDGRILPTTPDTGQPLVTSDDVAATAALNSPPIPKGNYILKIKADSTSYIMNSVQSTLDFYLAKKKSN